MEKETLDKIDAFIKINPHVDEIMDLVADYISGQIDLDQLGYGIRSTTMILEEDIIA